MTKERTDQIAELVGQYIELSNVGLIDEAEEMAAAYMDENGFGPAEAAYFDEALEMAGY